jgi:DNA-binding XRE family transcriptional regulator
MSKLRSIRKAAGLTQVQLSQRANVSRFRLCMAESDSLELRPDEIESIYQALKPEMERAVRIASQFQATSVARERRD